MVTYYQLRVKAETKKQKIVHYDEVIVCTVIKEERQDYTELFYIYRKYFFLMKYA